MNRPMRVVVFSERLWPEGSGGELATYLILKLLASTGDFELEVYTGTEDRAKVPGASIKVVDLLRASNKVELFTKILANRRLVEKAIERADVVYIPRFSYPVIPVAKKLGKKVVVHLHDYQPVSYTSVIFSSEVERPMSDFKRTFVLERASKPLPLALVSVLASPLTKLIRIWVEIADRIVCVSHRQEELLLRLAPEYKGKTIVIYNPLPEISNVRIDPSESPTLLYVGGESYVKGFHVLLKTLRSCRKNTGFKLVMTNKYSQRSLKILRYLKRQLNLNVQVLGLVSYEKLAELHSQAWALLFPSIWEEPLPYAVLESLVHGTIPIASRVGGVVELAEDLIIRDYLFTPDDEIEFMDRIERIIAMDRQQIRDLRVTLRENTLSRFNTKKIAKSLIEVFS
ncbi:MAG: glycosyltransferase family 4 protein [Desulfurococcaceae archaeon]